MIQHVNKLDQVFLRAQYLARWCFYYINDIGDNLNYSTIRLFADDCLLYKTISNQDDFDRLQDDLDKVQ